MLRFMDNWSHATLAAFSEERPVAGLLPLAAIDALEAALLRNGDQVIATMSTEDGSQRELVPIYRQSSGIRIWAPAAPWPAGSKIGCYMLAATAAKAISAALDMQEVPLGDDLLAIDERTCAWLWQPVPKPMYTVEVNLPAGDIRATRIEVELHNPQPDQPLRLKMFGTWSAAYRLPSGADLVTNEDGDHEITLAPARVYRVRVGGIYHQTVEIEDFAGFTYYE